MHIRNSFGHEVSAQWIHLPSSHYGLSIYRTCLAQCSSCWVAQPWLSSPLQWRLFSSATNSVCVHCRTFIPCLSCSLGCMFYFFYETLYILLLQGMTLCFNNKCRTFPIRWIRKVYFTSLALLWWLLWTTHKGWQMSLHTLYCSYMHFSILVLQHELITSVHQSPITVTSFPSTTTNLPPRQVTPPVLAEDSTALVAASD